MEREVTLSLGNYPSALILLPSFRSKNHTGVSAKYTRLRVTTVNLNERFTSEYMARTLIFANEAVSVDYYNRHLLIRIN